MAGLGAGSRLGLGSDIGFTYQEIDILGAQVRVRVRVKVRARVRVRVSVRVRVKVKVSG